VHAGTMAARVCVPLLRYARCPAFCHVTHTCGVSLPPPPPLQHLKTVAGSGVRGAGLCTRRERSGKRSSSSSWPAAAARSVGDRNCRRRHRGRRAEPGKQPGGGCGAPARGDVYPCVLQPVWRRCRPRRWQQQVRVSAHPRRDQVVPHQPRLAAHPALAVSSGASCARRRRGPEEGPTGGSRGLGMCCPTVCAPRWCTAYT
jgi:hypothetical protein